MNVPNHHITYDQVIAHGVIIPKNWKQQYLSVDLQSNSGGILSRIRAF